MFYFCGQIATINIKRKKTTLYRSKFTAASSGGTFQVYILESVQILAKTFALHISTKFFPPLKEERAGASPPKYAPESQWRI